MCWTSCCFPHQLHARKFWPCFQRHRPNAAIMERPAVWLLDWSQFLRGNERESKVKRETWLRRVCFDLPEGKQSSAYRQQISVLHFRGCLGWKNTKISHATPCLLIDHMYEKETSLLTMVQMYRLLNFTALKDLIILLKVLLVYKININIDFFFHSPMVK